MDLSKSQKHKNNQFKWKTIMEYKTKIIDNHFNYIDSIIHVINIAI